MRKALVTALVTALVISGCGAFETLTPTPILPTITNAPTRFPTQTPNALVTPVLTPTPAPDCVTAEVALHLRSGSSTSTEILAYIPYGQPVTVIMRAGAWSQIETKIGDKTYIGFVHSGYIGQCP